MADTTRQTPRQSAPTVPIADAPLAPIRVILRAFEAVEGHVTAQFFTLHRDGGMTASGLLSVSTDEWRSPAWQAVRDAVWDCTDDTGRPCP